MKWFLSFCVLPRLSDTKESRRRCWTHCAEAVLPFAGLKTIEFKVAEEVRYRRRLAPDHSLRQHSFIYCCLIPS